MQPQKRFAIYARIATPQELNDNFPMQEQIRRCKEYGQQQGYQLVEECVYEEVGSGSSIDRQVLKAVLSAAEEGKFDVLIIRSFDRISRNVNLVEKVIRTLEEYGVKIISATEDEDLQKMAFAIFEEVGRIERERLAARTRLGRQAKKLSQEGR